MNLLSPAVSPSLKSKDLDPASHSRKRQRSESMQSTTSSVKRSASEDPTSTTPAHATAGEVLQSITVGDSDIEDYMMIQGDDNGGDLTLTHPTHQVLSPNLTPADKFEYIKGLRASPMRVGETWYVVSREWYRRWAIACQGGLDKSGPIEEQNIPPVDNTSLVDRDGNITSSSVEGEDVEFVPEDAWKAFTAWYGPAPCPLPRSVILRGQFPSLELRPLRLRVLHLVESISDGLDRGPEYVTLSVKNTVRALSIELLAKLPAQSDTPFKIWKINPGEYEGLQFPVEKFPSSEAELLEISDKTLEESLIKFDDHFVVEFQQNGKWVSDQSSGLAESITPPPLFSLENDFFSHLGSSSRSTQQRASSPFPSSSIFKVQEKQTTAFKPNVSFKSKVLQEPGTLGLSNMGNTCFMNSALQCLAHTKELTDYFLSGVYESELNPDNPLGMQGAIAQVFGKLLHRIWAKDSATTTYPPREFKLELQRFAPQFSGYQQHDSQELVAFLLDGLHEDLNRVRKKPYVEKPDWEGGGNLELARLAQKSWQGYMQRNDSVIVDLFQGQYQSTLVCPVCRKVSITFDPFMYLTLPIPVDKKWEHTIHFVPWDPSKSLVKVPVEIGRDASFKELRSLLGRWMDVPAENLLTIEVFASRFYKNLDDRVLCADMAANDQIMCYELPCNARQSRLYKKKHDDPFIVPIFLMDPSPSSNHGYRSQSLFGYPFITVIDQDEAQSVEGIYDAVVQRLQQWTTMAADLFVWEEAPAAVPLSVPPLDSLTEIKENGDVVSVGEMAVEDDITDQKHTFEEEDAMVEISTDIVPHVVGIKQDVFPLHLQSGQKQYGTVLGLQNQRFVTWEGRMTQVENGVPLLKDDDALFCEFDSHMKAYFFGEEHARFEHALWESWETFVHPEYAQAKKMASEKSTKGISIDDCLEEFTKEEQLGTDDLWYCPRCKEHQQASKKFDLWKAPDILAVHLKRFSNSRVLRDKIDAFVDFPIEGLDLTHLVGERKIGSRLSEEGVDIQDLGIHDVDEPLIYDLYAVDEHLGSLGGGHYRAYALNHVNGQWYHFDDSYVTRTEARHAVNANAYLLFYKRRTNNPLGGKTIQKIEEAKKSEIEESIALDSHEPPTEDSASTTIVIPQITQDEGWPAPHSPAKTTPPSSLASLASDDSPPTESIIRPEPLRVVLHMWSTPSPTSSLAGEADETRDEEFQKLDSPNGSSGQYWNDSSSASPAHSDTSSNLQKTEGQSTDYEEIPGP